MAKYIIIGGVAGGATTAARLRRMDENCDILLIERGEYISYANCGLPYYIGDVISEQEKLFVQSPEGFHQRFNIDVRIQSEVMSIDTKKKTVHIYDQKKDTLYQEKYDKLVLSPGASPIKPPIPGINSNKIFTLRNVEDTDQIKEYITAQQIKRAVVVGAGFIGLEMAENLHLNGIQVTVVEMSDQVMNVLDYDMAAEVHQHLKMKNVEFYLKDGVSSFYDQPENIKVQLSSGKSIETDIVILSIGVKPELKLAKDSGLKIGELGGIFVNEFLLTSDPDIYALGDVIEYNNPVINKKVLIPLAGPANKQGRIIADNIVHGNKKKYKGTIGTAIAKVFDITVASTGANEKLLKKHGIDYHASITHSSSHAGYYPGAIPMTVKLIFSPDNGKVFGAQIVGYEGVDKRIDLIAATINKEGTIYDLQEIEHAYAPPYSSAKDPVNIAGFTAENILNGTVKVLFWQDIHQYNQNDIFLLDVRTREEYELGNIDQSVNIPIDDLREQMEYVPKNKKIIVYCQVGLRGYLACRILTQSGFDEVYNLSGGYKTYEHVTQKQSNEDIFEHEYINKDDMIYRQHTQNAAKNYITVDACGLQCPGPIRRLKEEADRTPDSNVINIQATDPGFYKDVKSWANVTGNKLLAVESKDGIVQASIEINKNTQNKSNQQTNNQNNKTIVVFSDDFDKALASFVIANGAAAMGKKVTLFFTFWGLNIIKKNKKAKVKKDMIGKMFSAMLPQGSSQLKLSKMHMSGMGTTMMRSLMKKKRVDSLEFMIENGMKNGIEIIACQMSMDLMGIKKEELLDGIQIGGVAAYLEETEKSNLNLFV